jgi:trigger factor
VAAWGRRLVITVPAGRVKAERAKVSRNLAKRVRIPGFRKGKIPPQRLEARFGPEIDRQTQQEVIDIAFREAVQAKEIEPISEPRVANVSWDRDSELTFEVAFDIRPEIRLARLGGFRLARPEISVSEEEVESQLEMLRRQQALWKPVNRRPAAGDTVEVEITPQNGEQEQAGQPYRFVLGEGRAIPDVEAAIMTLEPGNADDFSVAFPDGAGGEEQRVETKQLRIDLKQVLEQELPPLNDEFARSVGEFEELSALRDAVSDDLRSHKELEVGTLLNQQLVDQIIEANPFEVPESMIERYVDALVGAPPEGADPDVVAKAREEARPAAEWGIKRTLILQRVAEEQGLQALREEVQERLEILAKQTGRSASEVRTRLAKSGDLRDLERRITESKVFSYLREQSEIVDSR